MITAPAIAGRTPVEPLRWTPSGKVQVLERHPSGGRFYSVPVFSLRHDEGRDALTRAIANLPRDAAP